MTDGYPDDEDLDYLKNSSFEGLKSFEEIKILFEATGYSNCRIERDTGKWVLTLSTGGWSGCEEMIGALMRNFVWWGKHWYSTQRGGLYIFECEE